MIGNLRTIFIAMCAVILGTAAVAQVTEGKTSPDLSKVSVHLELSYEIATITAEGYPAALRITLKNAGVESVDFPMPVVGCGSSDGSLEVVLSWRPDGAKLGSGRGCSSDSLHRPKLMDRARYEWLRLQPDEFITITQNLRPELKTFGPGTVTYSVRYTPPRLSEEDKLQLRQEGYNVPSKEISTKEESFHID